MSIERAFVNVTTPDLQMSKSFYERLGYVPRFESDWFIQLEAPSRSGLEIGLLYRTGNVVPDSVRTEPAGILLTVVVQDVDAVFRALEPFVTVIEPPRDLFYGQRRLLVRAPEGTLVDVSSACAPDPQWMKRVTQGEDGVFRETQ